MSDRVNKIDEHAELWKLALDNSLDGLWDWDLENDNCYFSPRYYTMLGYEVNEFPASAASWQKLVHPDDFAKMAKDMQTIVTPQNPSYSAEVRMKNKQGEWHWILTRGKVIRWSNTNQALRMLGIHTDITQRKIMEEELRESQAQAKALLDASMDAIALVDADGVLLAVNNVFLTRWNVKEEDIIKKYTSTILPRPTLDERMKKVREIIKTGKPQVFIDEVKNRFFEVSMAPTHPGENHKRAVAIFSKEITAQKKAEINLREMNNLLEQTIIRAEEQAEKAMRDSQLKSIFMANIGQEMEIPLNSIIKNLERLKETAMLPEQKQEISSAQNDTKNLFELLKNAIDFSNIETGNIHIQESTFNLHSLLKSSLDSFELEIKRKRITSHFSYHESLPLHFQGDSEHLSQCINNLLSNAIRFTDKGGVSLDVNFEGGTPKEIKDRVLVNFSIKDTGNGVDQKLQNKFFDPPELESQGPYNGIRLSLKITKDLVEQMGGGIRLESELGKGTNVNFYIPLVICNSKKQ